MATRTFAKGLSFIGEFPLGHFSFFSFFRAPSNPCQKICPSSDGRRKRRATVFPDPLPKEVHELAVHFVRVGPGDAVRPVLHYQYAGSLDQLGGPESRGT